MAREDAVVDGVMANGLVDNSQPKLALAYVLEVVKAREEEQVGGWVGGSVCVLRWHNNAVIPGAFFPWSSRSICTGYVVGWMIFFLSLSALVACGSAGWVMAVS